MLGLSGTKVHLPGKKQIAKGAWPCGTNQNHSIFLHPACSVTLRALRPSSACFSSLRCPRHPNADSPPSPP